jgi:hypothetical protein
MYFNRIQKRKADKPHVLHTFRVINSARRPAFQRSAGRPGEYAGMTLSPAEF